MAAETVSAPEHESAHLDVDEIDNLLGLFQWIETARQALSRLEVAATNHEALAGELRKHEVAWVHDWEERHSAALFKLIEDVAQAVLAMSEKREQSHG